MARNAAVTPGKAWQTDTPGRDAACREWGWFEWSRGELT